MTKPAMTIPPERLRRRVLESLITVFLALIFLGIPFAFVLVPLIELAATIRAQRADTQLKRQGEKGSVAAIFAVGLGAGLCLITTIIVAARLADLYDKMKDRERAQAEPRRDLQRSREPERPPDAPPDLKPAYVAALAADAAFATEHGDLGTIAVPTYAEMGRRFDYRSSEEFHSLDGTLELAGLRLSLVKKHAAGTVLRIENRTKSFVAYRVDTSFHMNDKCEGFDGTGVLLRHVVLKPGEVVQRLECRTKAPLRVYVRTVETLALATPLAAYYASKVPPQNVGIEERTASQYRGHFCHTEFVSASWKWRDVMDFYARHDCANYQYSSSYEAFQRDEERPLPAVPPR